MKHRLGKIRIIGLIFLLTSCSSTHPFVAEETLDKSVSLEDKLEYYGGREIYVDEPEMFFSGESWLSKLTEEVGKAEDYILIYTYLGSSVPGLENLFSILGAKAEEGVDVYVAVDGSSILDMTETKKYMTSLFPLRDRGVNLLYYSPMSFSHIIEPSKLFVRDHRKMFVIDGKVSAIGGMNLNYISIGAGEDNQRDSMFLFHSPSLASMLVENFVSLWNEGSVETISLSDFATYKGEGEYRAWLFNGNVYSSETSISGMYGSLLNEAEESVFLCPYLPTLDSNMIEGVRLAVEKGVAVTFYCSQDPRAYLKKGMAWGNANVVEKTGITYVDVSKDENGEAYPLFHMKMMIVDDRYLVIGSANFNFRSMALNHEMVLVIDSPSISAKAKEEVMSAIGNNPVIKDREELERIEKEQGSFLGFLIAFFGG